MRTALFILSLAIGAVAVAQESVPELRRSSDAGQRVFDQRAGQDAEKPPNSGEQEEPIFTIVEEMPSFPGGEEALLNYIRDKIRYPHVSPVEAVPQGVVYVTFVVEPDGRITRAKVIQGVGPGYDEEALRVVKNMPPWIPGKQGGQPVRVQYNLPVVRFKL